MGQPKNSHKFWNKEYSGNGKHLALSANPSEDLIKFIKWAGRNDDLFVLDVSTRVLDLGCGNGRNLIYLAKQFGISGIGYDISSEAIQQAKGQSVGLNIAYETRSIDRTLPLADESQSLVLDMMTSHFLDMAGRQNLIKEIHRVLQPEGWLFFKTFLLDEDMNAQELIKKYPGKEAGTYIHPKIGVSEHVFTEPEIKELLKDKFEIHKMLRSHRHIERGHAAKRRSISVYARKI